MKTVISAVKRWLRAWVAAMVAVVSLDLKMFRERPKLLATTLGAGPNSAVVGRFVIANKV